ncbi:hypothetical protein [Kitasatospora sp. P5_F3]
MTSEHNSVLEQAAKAALLLVGIAVGARVAWALLAPLTPLLISLAVVLGVFWAAIRRR